MFMARPLRLHIRAQLLAKTDFISRAIVSCLAQTPIKKLLLCPASADSSSLFPTKRRSEHRRGLAPIGKNSFTRLVPQFSACRKNSRNCLLSEEPLYPWQSLLPSTSRMRGAVRRSAVGMAHPVSIRGHQVSNWRTWLAVASLRLEPLAGIARHVGNPSMF